MDLGSSDRLATVSEKCIHSVAWPFARCTSSVSGFVEFLNSRASGWKLYRIVNFRVDIYPTISYILDATLHCAERRSYSDQSSRMSRLASSVSGFVEFLNRIPESPAPASESGKFSSCNSFAIVLRWDCLGVLSNEKQDLIHCGCNGLY